jgi:meiotically up-regulated gene 157 (Mug157) protein
METLTPIYVVAFRIEGIAGNNVFFDGDTTRSIPLAKPDKFGVQSRTKGGPKEFTKNQSITRAKELESQGKRVKAYHYGFKERGFRSGENACEIAYQSPNWND